MTDRATASPCTGGRPGYCEPCTAGRPGYCEPLYGRPSLAAPSASRERL